MTAEESSARGWHGLTSMVDKDGERQQADAAAPVSQQQGDGKRTRQRRPRPVVMAVEPGLLETPAAAAFCGMGRSTFDAAVQAGKVGPMPVRIGGKKLWSVEELREWVRAGCPSRVRWQARRENENLR